jgi:hypothetical protein
VRELIAKGEKAASFFSTCHHTLARDFNPLEEAFAKIKGLLQPKVEARISQAPCEALEEAIGTERSR